MHLGRTDVKECVFFDFVRNSVRGRAAWFGEKLCERATDCVFWRWLARLGVEYFLYFCKSYCMPWQVTNSQCWEFVIFDPTSYLWTLAMPSSPLILIIHPSPLSPLIPRPSLFNHHPSPFIFHPLCDKKSISVFLSIRLQNCYWKMYSLPLLFNPNQAPCQPVLQWAPDI